MATKDPVKADIESRFTFHPATKETGPKHDAIRADLKRLALKWHRELPDGRQKSLALTSLEEAQHWANAAVAIGGSSDAAPVATPAPSGATSTPATGGTKKAAAKPRAKKTSTPTAPAAAARPSKKATPAKKTVVKKATAKFVGEDDAAPLVTEDKPRRVVRPS